MTPQGARRFRPTTARWRPARFRTNDDQLATLETEADQAAAGLVENLTTRGGNKMSVSFEPWFFFGEWGLGNEMMPSLVERLHATYTACARHTMALRARGLALDGTPDPAGRRRSFEPAEIRKDLELRIRKALKNVTPEQARAAYRHLMGREPPAKGAPARGLLVAADMLGSSRALRGLDPDGVQACREIFDGLLAAAVTAIGEKAGEQPEADIRQLHEATAGALGPDASLYPEAPWLEDDDRGRLQIDNTTVDDATNTILVFWYRALNLACLRDLAAPHRNPDAAAQPPGHPAANGPQALPMPGGDVAIGLQGDGYDSDDDRKVDEKGGANA